MVKHTLTIVVEVDEACSGEEVREAVHKLLQVGQADAQASQEDMERDAGFDEGDSDECGSEWIAANLTIASVSVVPDAQHNAQAQATSASASASALVSEDPSADQGLTEDAIAQFLQDLIESGAMAAEDVASRMARYGLMESSEFKDEMAERMDGLSSDEEEDADER